MKDDYDVGIITPKNSEIVRYRDGLPVYRAKSKPNKFGYITEEPINDRFVIGRIGLKRKEKK